MNKQNTEQLKKIEEIKEHMEELWADGDLSTDNEIWDFFLPHLISSDEIKREAVKKYIKWDYNSSKDLGDSYNAPEITEEQLNAYYADFEKYLTQSKEGGE